MKRIDLTILICTLCISLANGQNPILFLCPPCGLDCDTVHFQKPGICPVCGMKLFASFARYENKLVEHGDICHKKVAVVVFPGVEIIDFSGPWEVFGAAGMEVFSISTSDTVIATSMGLKIKPDYTLANAPVPDIILVPGGSVDPSDTALVNWLIRTSRQSEHTMSVCTGAFYLAAGGLLDGLKATTNYPAIPILRQLAPKTTVVDRVRFVDNGRIITSAGLSSGIDAAFHLVSLNIGKAQATKLANELEYGWSDTDPFVRSKLADKHVQDFLNVLTPFDYEMTEYSGDQTRWSVLVKVNTDLSKSDFLQLMETQFEQVSGWRKKQKSNNWFFDDSGEIWSATLSHNQAGNNAYWLMLKVEKN